MFKALSDSIDSLLGLIMWPLAGAVIYYYPAIFSLFSVFLFRLPRFECKAGLLFLLIPYQVGLKGPSLLGDKFFQKISLTCFQKLGQLLTRHSKRLLHSCSLGSGKVVGMCLRLSWHPVVMADIFCYTFPSFIAFFIDTNQTLGGL